MPFRFRRSIRLLPGLRLNLSGSGASLSARLLRVLTLNFRRRGVRATVDAPGTGLSWWGWLFQRRVR